MSSIDDLTITQIGLDKVLRVTAYPDHVVLLEGVLQLLVSEDFMF